MREAVAETEADIWARTLKPDEGDLAPQTARFFLDLRLSGADTRRLRELSDKARQDTLTAEERHELDRYLAMGWFLDFMRSKARLSLKQTRVHR